MSIALQRAGLAKPYIGALILSGLLAVPLRAQCPDGSTPPCRSTRVAPAPAANTIAVLYFDNLSRDTADVYLADGLTEELINRLIQIEALQVKSRNAVARLRGRTDREPQAIGRELAVSQFLSGSVQRAGPRLRVNVELTRASSGNSVWARSFDRSAEDMLGVQAEIAESIAVHVAGRLAPAERQRFAAQATRNPKAYDHLLRGRFLGSQRTADAVRKSVGEFEAALKLDPYMLPALVGLGTTYGNLSSIYHDPTMGLSRDSLRALSKAAFDRAAAIDPYSPELAGARTNLEDPVLGVGIMAEAVARSPRSVSLVYSYGLDLRSLRRPDEAIEQFKKALALEPDRYMTVAMIAQTYHLMRRDSLAAYWADSAIAMRPDPAFIYGDQAWIRLALGDTAGARVSAEGAARHGGADTRETILAVIDVRRGDTAAARARLAPVETRVAKLDCIMTHACLELAYGLSQIGERDRALATMERIRPRESWLSHWSDRPELDPIRNDPRFIALIRETRENVERLRRGAARP